MVPPIRWVPCVSICRRASCVALGPTEKNRPVKLNGVAFQAQILDKQATPSAPLTDGVGSVLDREVYFPLAGYAGPGFHNWPGSADVLVGEYETGDSHPKKRRSERRSAPPL